MGRITLVLAVAAASLLAAATTSGAASSSARPVVIVPIGNVGASAVSRTAAVLRNELGLHVRVAPTMAVRASTRDPKRKQVVADRLVEQIRQSVPAAGDGRSVVLGLTREDIYPLNSGWQWEFASRSASIGLISLARMDNSAFGLEPNAGLSARRLHKYILRYGALLALGEAESSDPRSLLYGSIGSTDDLDFAEPQLPPPPLTAARRQWLQQTEVGCAAAAQTLATVLKALNTATAEQVPDLLAQWSDADTALAGRVLPNAAGAPTPRALVLVAALRQRAAFLRSIERTPLPLSQAQLKHLSSINASLRAAMFEIGSKACGSKMA
jgi:predicted Zn-dependent protease